MDTKNKDKKKPCSIKTKEKRVWDSNTELTQKEI